MFCHWRILLFPLILASASRPSAADDFRAVAVSPDGKVVAAGGAQGVIRLWDAKTGTPIHEMQAAKAVQGLAFVRDDKTLAVGTNQGGVEIWAAKAAGYARTVQFRGDEFIFSVTASADGKTLAVCGHNGWTHLHETTDWKPVGVIFERSNLTSGVVFANDGSFLATAGNTFSVWNLDSTSALWKARGERTIDDIETTTKQSLRWAHATDLEPNDEVYCADVAISSDARRVVGVNGTSRHDGGGKRLFAWEAATGKKLWTARAAGMTCVTFIADGKRIATGSHDGTVRVWGAESGNLLYELKCHTKAVRSLAAMPQGAGFVSAAQDGTVILWDSAAGKRIRVFSQQ
jgi:WD40 repeat protein